MKTPLLVRWPGKIKAGTVNSNLVQNIDFAPTFLDLAEIRIPAWMQGVSIKRILENPTARLDRNFLYYHFYEDYADHTVLPHLGVRSENYKLIYFYTVDEWELYDLKKDPQELANVYADKKYREILDSMKKQLLRLRNQYDDHEQAGVLR